MRKRVAAYLGALALVAGSIGLAVQASADSTPTSTPAASSTTAPAPVPARGWCVKSGTGELRNLWLVPATGKCPAPFWGPTTLGSGTPGPAGPKGDVGPAGPKGDPGDSRIVIASGSVKVTAAGTYSVTVAGLPKLTATQAKRYLADVDGEVLAAGVTAKIGAPTADTAGTTWTFPLVVAGYTDKTPDTVVKVDVLAIPPVTAS